MFSRSDVVADVTGKNGPVWSGHFHGGESFETEEIVDGLGVGGGEEFTFGVGPVVFGCAGNVNRPGGDERNELVLVDWKVLFFLVESVVVSTKPMGERFINACDAFAVFATSDGSSGAP
ncbi:MAG: hypothetical protein P8M08_04105 [Akkermansiaceae bacterium]|nr:hypothetical protein [Akkermansiaceae bacterium]